MDPGIPSSNQKSGQVWFDPPVPVLNGLCPLKIAKKNPLYVRRSELVSDFELRISDF
jgi:hypothetical protein